MIPDELSALAAEWIPCRVKARFSNQYKRLCQDFLEEIKHNRSLLGTLGMYYGAKSDANLTPRFSRPSSYRILLLLGDDLADFVSAANQSPKQRIEIAEQNSDRWGTKWFLLPNPVYGSWDGSLYRFNYSLTRPEVLKIKWDILKGFKKPCQSP